MKKVVSILIICLILMTGCSVKKTNEVTDEEKFAMEYGVSHENPFEYLSYEKIEKLLTNGSGIIYFGNSNDETSRNVSNYLIELTKETDIETIYYYDPTTLKRENKKQYKELVKLLNEQEDNIEDLKTIKIPSIYILNNGKVESFGEDIFHQLDTKDDLNTNDKEKIKERYINILESN